MSEESEKLERAKSIALALNEQQADESRVDRVLDWLDKEAPIGPAVED